MQKKTDIIDFYGTNRSRQQHNNYFEEYMFDDMRLPTIYNTNQKFAYWQGVRHRHDMGEYFKSTQNPYGYRVERQEELENRLLSPGSCKFFKEITPERLAHDPEGVIYNYYNGWEKNLSDGNTGVNMLRSQLRKERKGNYFRVSNDVYRFVYSTHQGANGPIYHPDLM